MTRPLLGDSYPIVISPTLEQENSLLKGIIEKGVYKSLAGCRVVGATCANEWLIIVGASKTSPVPGNGIRRRHARRRILPRFGALRGDNTPSPALRGLRMITRSVQVATSAPRAIWLEEEEGQG